MRTRVTISVTLLAAATFFGLITFLAHESEHKGGSLSHWLATARATDTPAEQRQEAGDAIRRLGPRALPLLLKWATMEPSQKKRKIQTWLAKVPTSLVPRRLRNWADQPPDQTRANEAKLGLLILGPDAAPAIPQLARLAKQAPADQNTYWAFTALGNIGPKALPTLFEILADPKIPWRRVALQEIAGLGTNALPALPTIIRLLDDPDPQTTYASAFALGKLVLSPDLSIPALKRCLEKPDSQLRVAAASSIANFGTHAQAAIPAIEVAESTETEPFAKRSLQFILKDLKAKAQTANSH
jgi:HEAT repeat protein